MVRLCGITTAQSWSLRIYIKENNMAKITGINHISFAVQDLDESIQSIKENFGGIVIVKFQSIEGKYIGAGVQLGDSQISFIQPTDETSFVAEFIKKKGLGIQHIGLEVDNIEEFVRQLEGKGIKVDKAGMRNEKFKEALVGPKTGFGVVLQLTQWRDGPMDLTPEGKERGMQKYRETPGLRIIE